MKFFVDTCAWIRAVSTKTSWEDLQKTTVQRESKLTGDPSKTRREICKHLFNGEIILVTPSLIQELQKQKNRLEETEKQRLSKIIELLTIIQKLTKQPQPPEHNRAGLQKHDQTIRELNLRFSPSNKPFWKTIHEETPKVIDQKFSETIRNIPKYNEEIYKAQEDPKIQKRIASLLADNQRLDLLTQKAVFEKLPPNEEKERKELLEELEARTRELKKLQKATTPKVWTDLENALHASKHHAKFITADSDILLLHEILPLDFTRIQSEIEKSPIPYQIMERTLETSIEKIRAKQAGLTKSKKIRVETPQKAAELEQETAKKGGKILHWTKTQKEILLPGEE